MDEEIAIIDEKTRNEKIKSFFIDNKKLLILSIGSIVLIIFCFYFYQIYQDKHKEQLSDKFNSAIVDYNSGNKNNIVSSMREIIENKNSTYSPLALYFLIDNQLIDDQVEVNKLFDILLEKTSLEDEIRNLIVYKKALYNADNVDENKLLDILKPLINSESVWKSHALYLVAEYFYSKNEKQKSKEFFNQIISTDNANQDILNEAKKRLSRDLSE